MSKYQKEILSESSAIDRDVVQGDVVSPLYFILALELILKCHDNTTDKGVTFGGQRIHTLGYADDAALLDTNISAATERVTAIARGSKSDADMVISIAKTEVIQVCEQGRIPAATATEAKSVFKHECPHLGYNRMYYNTHGLKCHIGKYKMQK